MPIIRRLITAAGASCVVAVTLAAQAPTTPDLAAARALVNRVIPGHDRDIVVAAIPLEQGHDVFEVAGGNGHILLRGSSGVAIASALNWYLIHVAHTNVSLPLQPIHLASPLPPVTAPAHVTTPYTIRYFFNYCTFSYSMAWWTWTDWQRMIDWMALKGINAPLAVTGQEAVWRAVLTDMGFSKSQIGAFLVGPAYLPWGWMGNIDSLGGPLPDHWIDSHVTLERQILARERALGMTPILQGFTGHVPESIKSVLPAAHVQQTGDWSAGFHGTWFLDPLDPLFQQFGTRFIARQRELYGTDHLYAADPFNEIDPPSNDTTFLASMSHAIYGAMHTADSSATWVLQAWFLYYQTKFWKEPQARAFLGAVPDDHMLVLDLWGDLHPAWQARQAFYGKPWIWNVLYNFGGKVTVNGDLPAIAKNLDAALRSPAKGRLTGLGMMMEGLGTNPIVPDFVMDQVWRDSVPAVTDWTHDYISRRYGSFNDHAWSAWQLLLATAFKSSSQTGDFLAERPQFYRKGVAYRSEPIPPYDNAVLARALDSLLAAAPALSGNDAYRYDVVNLARQVLGQRGLPLVNAVESAYNRKDRVALLAAEGEVIALLRDLDALVGTRPEFLLGRWIADARQWGTTDAERRLYQWNARNIITLWGTKCTEGQNDDLNLYAFKEWEGMFSSYFLPRWQAFFAALNGALDKGVPFDRKPYAEAMCQWEQRWSNETGAFPTQPKGDGVAMARRLVTKWGVE
ncbi:MAG TPA: alpha-N-acetylglucosaminidase [Gemmatimonadales bacterium]